MIARWAGNVRRVSALALVAVAAGLLAVRAQDGARPPATNPERERALPPYARPPLREGVPYLRLFVIGDMGTGRPSQRKVAQVMAARAAADGLDAIVTVGDNVYPDGVTSVDDPQWRTKLFDVYAAPALAVPIYPSLGNHDHRGDVQAQVDYARKEPRWRMTGRYYAHTFRLGPAGAGGEGRPDGSGGATVDLVVVDTQTLRRGDGDPEQQAWLARTLAASKATWKLVAGHHPVHTHGRYRGDARLAERLEPLLVEHEVDLYLAGHDHSLQLIGPKQGVLHLVSGAAGGLDMAYPVTWGDDSLFSATGGGFTTLRLAPDEGALEFVRDGGETAWGHVVRPRGAARGPY